MIKLLIVLTLCLQSAFSGTLENRKTGEKLNFELTSGNYIRIYSNETLLKTMNYRYINVNRSNPNLLAGNHLADNYFYEDVDLTLNPNTYEYETDFGPDIALSVLIPLYNLPRVAGTVYDIVALPFKLTGKIVKNIKYKKDFNKLSKAVNTNTNVKVSNNRFRRVEKLIRVH
jgi:hypothetical protein